MPVQFACALPISAALDLAGPARSAYDVASDPYGQPRMSPHGCCPGGRIAALSTCKGFTARCSAAARKPTTAPIPDRYFCELRLQRSQECPAIVFWHKFQRSRANEADLTKPHFPRVLAHCFTGYPCRSCWGSLLPQSDPQPLPPVCFPAHPFRRNKLAAARPIRPGHLGNQALHKSCAK